MSVRLAVLRPLTRSIPVALAVAFAASVGAQAPAPTGPCATPRSAVDTLLRWQQPDTADPVRAAACVDVSQEADASVAVDRARLIKEVLDARGLFVQMDRVPDDPAHVDAQNRRRHVLFPDEAPQLFLTRSGERWLWSAETVAIIPELHAETFAIDLERLSSRLPKWAQGTVLGLEVWKVLGLLALLFLALLVRLVVVFVVTSQARRLMQRVHVKWGDELLARVGKPVGTLFAAGTFALLLPALRLPVRLAQVGVLAVRVVAALSVVWAVYRLIDLFTGWLDQKAGRTETKMDDQLVPLVRTALKVFTVALGIVFVLQNLDVDVGSLLAGLGIGGLAFALAAQDTVKNLFGALTIFLDRPFQIGDWVVTAGTEGVVESVGFRSVRIRTFYNSLMSVPNAKVADSTIDNYGARQYRRVKTTVGLTYDTSPEQMQAFVEGVRAILQANPHTRKDYYEVHFRDFGPSSLDIMLYFFLVVPSWSEELRQRHNIFLEIIRLAGDLGVDFAFPTQTLHIESHLQGAPAARVAPPDLAAVVRGYGPDGDRGQPGARELTEGYFSSPAARGSEADGGTGE